MVVAAPDGYAVRRVGVADHDVPALPGPEPVVAVAGRGALRRVVVAAHEVVAGAAADHVSAIDAAGVDVVADEDVVAAIAVDLVVAGAADHAVAAAAGADQVTSAAAVHHVVAAVSVDDVPAGGADDAVGAERPTLGERLAEAGLPALVRAARSRPRCGSERHGAERHRESRRRTHDPGEGALIVHLAVLLHPAPLICVVPTTLVRATHWPLKSTVRARPWRPILALPL